MIAFAVALLAGAPTTATSSATPGFVHSQHAEGAEDFTCSRCHVDADIQPGRGDHGSCDASGCHADDFGPRGFKTTKVCGACHLTKTLLQKKDNLHSYPPTSSRREFYAEFSHATHLGDYVEDKSEQACLQCHTIDETGKVDPPGHEQCTNCHASDQAAKAVLMSSCENCHRPKIDPVTRVAVSTGPRGRNNPCRVTKKFSHETHRRDQRVGKSEAVSCGVCHVGLTQAVTRADIVPTRGRRTMQACGQCHRSGQRSQSGKRLVTIQGECTSCHELSCLTFGPAPSWHR